MAEVTSHTEEWEGKDRPNAPDVPFHKGYDVETTAMQANQSGFNAWLTDSADNKHVKLTITAIDVSLALAGSRGQSQLTRDFYPRNFQQPAFSVTCRARSQREIGRVAEFVHKAQRNALTRGSLMGLVIPRAGLKHTQNGMRGIRQGISLAGYVRAMPRSHRRHDPAPEFTFEFTVARSRTGLWHDEPYKAYKLAKWSDIVETLMAGNFIKPPEPEADKSEAENIRNAIENIVEDIPFLGDLFD